MKPGMFRSYGELLVVLGPWLVFTAVCWVLVGWGAWTLWKALT